MGQIIQTMDDALRMVASGTDLRAALDMIAVSNLGALVCVGDVDHVLEIASGGFKIDAAFTAHRLFELAKMDGGIILDGHAQRIIAANMQLTPTVRFETKETGMRHRTAMCMCVQTDAVALTVSERRHAIDVYFGGESVSLSAQETAYPSAELTIKALRCARDELDREIDRLSSLNGNEEGEETG